MPLIRYALDTLRYVPSTNQVIIRVDVNYISETRDTAGLTVSWNTVTMRCRDIMGIPCDFWNTKVCGSLFGAGIFMVGESVPTFINVLVWSVRDLSTNSGVNRCSKISEHLFCPLQLKYFIYHFFIFQDILSFPRCNVIFHYFYLTLIRTV